MLLGREERTIYDWWAQGKLGVVPVGKRGKRTTPVMVEARRQQLETARQAVAGVAGLPNVAPTPTPATAAPPDTPLPAPEDGPDAANGYPGARELEATARFILGEAASEAEVAQFATEVLAYRKDIQRLVPQTRTLLARTYFRWVREAVADVASVAATLVCAATATGLVLGAA